MTDITDIEARSIRDRLRCDACGQFARGDGSHAERCPWLFAIQEDDRRRIEATFGG